jgi:purine-binding chemotaxis protein CheW
MKRYLAFTVADLALAIQLEQVAEVVEVPSITKVPRPARHIEGLASLRGKPIPVVDLRKRLGLVNPVPSSDARMIIASPGGRGEPLGFIVDTVGEILSVGESEVPTRAPAPWVDERLLTGSLEVHGRPVLLTDLVKIMESG